MGESGGLPYYSKQISNPEKKNFCVCCLHSAPKMYSTQWNHFWVFWPKVAHNSLWLAHKLQSEAGFCWPLRWRELHVGWWLAMKQESKGILGVKEFWGHFISNALKIPFIIIIFFLSLLLCKGCDFLLDSTGTDNLKWLFVASMTSWNFLERKQFSDSWELIAVHLVNKGKLLANTLVPLVVLEIALGAAAPVAPDDVLAAMLAAMVPFALVHIWKRRQSRL